MDRHIDLTDKGDFSRNNLSRKIKLTRVPWQQMGTNIRRIPWLLSENICERCGTDIEHIPWDITIPGLCHKCSLLFVTKEELWSNESIEDKKDLVFLSDLR